MSALRTAIMTPFVSGTDLYDAIEGRMYYARAPKETEEPYVVFSIPNRLPEDTFSASIDNVTIQFSIFAATADDADDITTDCLALYDNTDLGDCVVLQRTLIIPARPSSSDEDITWQADIDFFTIQEV